MTRTLLLFITCWLGASSAFAGLKMKSVPSEGDYLTAWTSGAGDYLPKGMRVHIRQINQKDRTCTDLQDPVMAYFGRSFTSRLCVPLDWVQAEPPKKGWEDTEEVGNGYIKGSNLVYGMPMDDAEWTQLVPMIDNQPVTYLYKIDDRKKNPPVVIKTESGQILAVPHRYVKAESTESSKVNVQENVERVLSGWSKQSQKHTIFNIPPSDALVADAKSASGQHFVLKLSHKWIRLPDSGGYVEFEEPYLDPVRMALTHSPKHRPTKPWHKGYLEPDGTYLLDTAAYGAWWIGHKKTIKPAATAKYLLVRMEGVKTINGKDVPHLMVLGALHAHHATEDWSE